MTGGAPRGDDGPPFCHVFSVGNRDYAYDVGTNALLAVEPPLAALLRNTGNRDETVPPPGPSPAELAAAHDALARGRTEGLFSSHRPRHVALPGPDPGPCDRNLQHLVLTVTENCNLRCRYCLHGADLSWVRSHSRRVMSPRTAVRAVDYFLERSDPDRRPVISFYGGEPLLEIDLIEAVTRRIRRHPRGSQATLVLDTNGVLLGNRARDLVRREGFQLQVSLDGPPDVHDRLRRGTAGRPSHADIMTNLDTLLQEIPDLADRLVFVVTLAPPFDLPAVDDFFADFPLFAKAGITRPPLLRVNIADLAGQDWPDLGHHLSRAARQIEDLKERYLARILAGNHKGTTPVQRALFEADLVRFHHRPRTVLGDTIRPGSPCSLGRRKLHVAVDGSLYPCERTGQGFRLGRLDQGMDDHLVRKHRDVFWSGSGNRCTSCWAVRLCGLCHAHLARLETSRLADLPETECRRERERIEGVMKMMAVVLTAPRECRTFLDEYSLG